MIIGLGYYDNDNDDDDDDDDNNNNNNNILNMHDTMHDDFIILLYDITV
jgi:hypothetical protein